MNQLTAGSEGSQSDNQSVCPAKTWTKLWWVVIVVGVALKLFLTAHDGINPSMYDARNYAQAAGHLFSNSELSKIPSHRPGLPIIAAIVVQLGVPYKLYLEFLLLFNAAVAGLLVSRLMGSFLAGAMLFIAIAFNPWFMANSQIFMTEPLISALILMQLVFGAQMIVRPLGQWAVWHAVFAGSATMLHVLSRNETALVFLYWIAVAIVVLIRQRKTIFSARFFEQPVNAKIVLLVVPVAMTYSAIEGLKTYHDQKFGIAASCSTEGEGFVSLMEALYSIPPDEKIRYAPVTRQSLELACENSPTLAKYRDRLMDSSLSAYQFSKIKLGLENEMGTWLNWHLFNCFAGSHSEKDDEMKRAADEIRVAQAQGRLPQRVTKYPISPYMDLWIGDLWENFALSIRYSLKQQKTDLSGYYKNNDSHRGYEASLFDEGLLRRNGLLNDAKIAITGIFAGDSSAATQAVICDENENFIASAEIEFEPAEQGMMFNCVLDAIEYCDTGGPLFIYLQRDSATGALRSNRAELQWRRYQFFQFQFAPAKSDADDQESVNETSGQASIERWNLQSHRMAISGDNFKQTAKRKISDNYHWLLMGCWAIAFIAGLTCRCSRPEFFDVVWVGIAAIVFVLVRCLMYSLIHTWLLWGLHRYVEPNNLIFIVGLACLSFVIGGVVRALILPVADPAEAATKLAN
jgi:hypothetical protein